MLGSDFYIGELKKAAEKLGVVDLAWPVLTHPQFALASGNSKSNSHHYGDGGLCKHVYEVWSAGMDVILFFGELSKVNGDGKWDNFSLRIFFLAVIYHDYGKIFDCERLEDGTWVGTDHKRLVHHISKSNSYWCIQAEKYGAGQDFMDKVSHCILSHHGCREYGSPVSPKSREAWLLHLCDGISARMDDCDFSDVLTKYK